MIIAPTVGRKVWFYRSVADAADPSTQPQDATVVYVISDRLVNLRVSDHKGDQMPKLAIQLYQEGDEDPSGAFACWMPYQSEQAKKHAAPPAGTTVDQKHYNEVMTQVGELTSRVLKLEAQLAERAAQVSSPGESSSKDNPVQPPAGAHSGIAKTDVAPAPTASKQVTK